MIFRAQILQRKVFKEKNNTIIKNRKERTEMIFQKDLSLYVNVGLVRQNEIIFGTDCKKNKILNGDK